MSNAPSSAKLPRIGSYVMPTADELPPVVAPWRVQTDRVALLIHDMQQYFVDAFASGEAPVEAVVANIARLRDACDAQGVPVFYTAQHAAQDQRDRGLQAKFWGTGMATAEQAAIIPALRPGAGHHVLTKWRYSAFQRTPLEEMLRARGRSQLIVCGVYGHIGCLLSAADAFMRDIEPFLVSDAIGDFSRAHHDQAITYAASRCAVVQDTTQIVAALSGTEVTTS
ncbi:MAG TPA: 2,3-dihydro-2,3-dihydroxybenzoate synthetase [Gemmatimonas aurantiaca]|uniref:Isochorismatase n=2 Tax=Gemmatimonas aurantiaca TaxID=173480 RepID=C1ACN5_GEMAT|nr:isochorismatase family protein [Gemmatimonas aurantiaca]BAH40262.1 isochorismatase [Gemmatimonas aurantiaca T-27]HCT57728.1 2,3-dihydro-2,3-dihydroxybenzoate synthetase [Gemmatimonas aurantiaca]